MTQPLVTLIVLDGFGLAPEGPGNAVRLARTPVFDNAWNHYPHTSLHASGLDVGLPEGQMGNSEVGHLNLGAGRMVPQSLTYIDAQIKSGEYLNNPVIEQSAKAGNTWHLVGLVSDGGVHSSLEHLLGLITFAETHNVPRVRIHVITDGRDSAPQSALNYISTLERVIAASPIDVQIATVVGRYYAMDRDNRWERTQHAWDALIHRAGHTAVSATEAVQAAYSRSETDEFIKATVLTATHGAIEDGDSVFFFNFRADRMRQIVHAFQVPAEKEEFPRGNVPSLHLASLMEYQREVAVSFAMAVPPISRPLAEVISQAGLAQFHAAETEKYAHVTYFFNAQREEPYPGEERLLVPSPKVATYDRQPAMSAPELATKVAERIRNGDDSFVLVNFANPDMVGHTGVLQATIKACEVTDTGLGVLLDATMVRDGVAIIVADHGNAEHMFTEDGTPHTAHTTNPVPFVLYSSNPAWQAVELREGGRLADVAPTVLDILGVPQPDVMTGVSLLQRE